MEKLLRVAIKIKGVHQPKLSLALPSWTPGWYVLTDAEKGIDLESVTAQNNQKKALPLTHPDANTWTITDTQNADELLIAYTVRATDTGYGFFKPYLDAKHGFVPGPATLLYVVDGKQAPCSVRYVVPSGWRVASAATPIGNTENTFTAPDYDTLIDQPADLGEFTRTDRVIAGVPVSVVLVGSEGHPKLRWTEGVFKIAEAGIKLLGGPPFSRYAFQFHFTDEESGFFGGLEHLNSTVIRLGTETLHETSEGDFALVAHELTHAWNVKRARPRALGPFDYTQKVRVKDLWFCEGVTEYFAPKIAIDAGIGSQSFWLGYIAQNLTELHNNPARKSVTLEESSLKVWEGKSESEGFGGLSYYNKGMVVGLLLDIEMRRASNNTVGLVDLLKALVEQAKTTHQGFSDGEIERVAAKLCGRDLSVFFARALRSTEELDIIGTLRSAGILCDERVNKLPSIGIAVDSNQAVASVTPNSPAALAGVLPGDVLTSPIDLTNKKPGEKISLTVQRENKPITLSIVVGVKEESAYRLTPLPRPTPLQAAILKSISK
jgi:predicted metalloprotease with PDZ domain